MPTIEIVGLGPGDWSQLTVGTVDMLLAADVIYCRTFVHPTVTSLRERLRPEQHLHSFDDQYERAESFDLLYQTIVEKLIGTALESATPILYAVPGHPMIGEKTVGLLLAAAPARGVDVHVHDAVSFLEPVFSALAIDPLNSSLALLDGAALLPEQDTSLTDIWRGLSPRLQPAGRPMLIGQVYDRRVGSAVKLWLLERYPGTHPITVVRAAGTVDQHVQVLALAELDHGEAFDHLTSVYVPPLAPLDDTRSLGSLPYVAARLRDPDGCPWDRKQTFDSLKPHILEEAHELIAALDASDLDGVVEELGDVLFHVVMLSQIADESGEFDLPSVLEQAAAKLIRRHPHVFGEEHLDSADAVVRNWERIKADEREGPASVLAGVPAGMPSVIASQVMQRKAASLGFDWPSIDGVYAKVLEELDEVRAASPETTLEEAGDLLFALVSLCRHLKVDADEALRKANAKFRRRFEAVEAACVHRRLDILALDAQTLDALWEEVKAQERAS